MSESQEEAAEVIGLLTKLTAGVTATLLSAAMIGAYGWLWNTSARLTTLEQSKADAEKVQVVATDIAVMKRDLAYLTRSFDELRKELRTQNGGGK